MGLMEQQGGPDFHGESSLFLMFVSLQFGGAYWDVAPPAGLVQA